MVPKYIVSNFHTKHTIHIGFNVKLVVRKTCFITSSIYLAIFLINEYSKNANRGKLGVCFQHKSCVSVFDLIGVGEPHFY